MPLQNDDHSDGEVERPGERVIDQTSNGIKFVKHGALKGTWLKRPLRCSLRDALVIGGSSSLGDKEASGSDKSDNSMVSQSGVNLPQLEAACGLYLCSNKSGVFLPLEITINELLGSSSAFISSLKKKLVHFEARDHLQASASA
uniref:Uncharacterized protein n=1 Tax=Bionectria ochroleuca TaxID=29856 RepID=A0A0B7JSU8_BIOOC